MLPVMRRLLTTVVASLAVHGTALAGCPTPTDVADITEILDKIDAAYQSADTVAFTEGVSVLGPQLDCASEVLPRSLVARIHRTQGLAAFTQQDDERLTDAFAAAKALEPSFTYPESFVPAAHPVARRLAEVVVPTDEAPYAPPAEGFYLFDGAASDLRPAGRSVLLQHIVGRNEVALTRYLRPGDRGWAQLDANAVRSDSASTTRRTATPFWITSIATASLGGVVYGVAASRRSAYENAATIDKPPLRAQTNGLVTASLGLLGVSAGSAALGLVVSR